MAMIKCKECNFDISEHAEICPRCGCPVKREIRIEKLVIDVGAIIIAVISLVVNGVIAYSNSHYTADATIEAARINAIDELDKSTDLGNAFYKERSIYRGKGEKGSAVKAYPYGDGDANNSLEDDYGTKEFIIDAAVINIHQNVWYRIDEEAHSEYSDSVSGEAFIFNENVVYYKDAAQIDWVGGDIDSTKITEGNSHALKGKLTCTNRISKIIATIYRDGKLFLDSTELSLNLNKLYSYSMSDSELNTWFSSSLPVGDNYKLVLEIEYKTNGDKDINSQTWTSSFDIIPAK